MLTILCGDALEKLRELPDQSVHCCVTSPPYWGLRDYSCEGQLGLEKTPEEYVAKMVEVFREVRRVLRKNGTLWLNLGDSYAGSGKGPSGNIQSEASCIGSMGQRINSVNGESGHTSGDAAPPGLKPKDLCGIPWRVAFALQADGWYLRQDIIWAKPNPMPESVTDRCTKSHEYIFLLSKSSSYYFNASAIADPCRESSIERLGQDVENQEGSDRVPGKTNGKMKAVVFGGKNRCPDTRLQSGKPWNPSMAGGAIGIENRKHAPYPMANKRSVWRVPTQGYKDAHFATYPPNLIKPCILAGSCVEGIVLDPFAGSGTTGAVAIELGRKAILIELNEKYVELICSRCDVTLGLPLA